MIILFFVLFFIIFGRLLGFAFRAAWSIAKIAVFMVFLPLILVGLVINGLVRLALPILVIVGIVSLIKSAVYQTN